MTITTLPTVAPNVLKGILLVVAAVFLFAVCDSLTKHLALAYTVPFIMAVRYLINLGLLAAVLGPRQGAALWRTQRSGLVLLRGLCLAAGSLSMGLALRVMPVAETTAIVYLSPFLVMLAASHLMGEKVTLVGWLATFGGFLGVLLIVRPGSGLDPLGVALSIFNAGCATAYHLLTRFLARTETMTAMVFHTALVGAVVFTALALMTFRGPMPGMIDAGWLALLGLAATAAHFLFTAAYREAPASTLAPINYLHLVWAALLGWLVFDHLPDAMTLLGILAVLVSGVVVAIMAHQNRDRGAAAPAP